MNEDIKEFIDKRFKKIRNMKPYQGKSDEEVRSIATEQIEREVETADVVGKFKDKEEKKLAKELLSKYLADYSIETISDRNTLKDIIYLEILNLRIQNKLNDLSDTDNAIPTTLVDIIHKNLDALTKLKLTLGIAHRKDERRDGYSELEKLKKKFKLWRENNQGSRTLVCPHCAKLILLKIRMEAWEAQRHPFFKDRVLANKHLIKLLKEGKIDRDDVAKVLETSPDYIDWLIEKWFKYNAEGVTNVPGTTELDKGKVLPITEETESSNRNG